MSTAVPDSTDQQDKKAAPKNPPVERYTRYVKIGSGTYGMFLI